MSSLTPAEMEELADQIAESVAERLGNQPKLVDRVEMARQLGVSVPTLNRWRSDGKVPSIKAGSRILFEPSLVVRSLMEEGAI